MYNNDEIYNFEKDIDTLCFSGGGTKGLVFIGAIKALIEKNVIKLKNINKFIGTSAGALFAFLLSIGYTNEEVEEFVLNFDFSKLEPDVNCDDIFSNYGLDDGKKLTFMLKKLLHYKTNKESITFEELYELTNKELIIAATCINNSKVKYFNYKFTPEDDVILTVRMSVSVPFYFFPVKYEGNLYIDGGILDNYPIQFGNRETTLGLVVLSEKYNKIKDFGNYMIKVIKLILNANLINKIRFYKDCTIGIISSEKNFIDLKLNLNSKKILIDRGYNKIIKDYNIFTKNLANKIINQIIDKIDNKSKDENSINSELITHNDLSSSQELFSSEELSLSKDIVSSLEEVSSSEENLLSSDNSPIVFDNSKKNFISN